MADRAGADDGHAALLAACRGVRAFARDLRQMAGRMRRDPKVRDPSWLGVVLWAEAVAAQLLATVQPALKEARGRKR